MYIVIHAYNTSIEIEVWCIWFICELIEKGLLVINPNPLPFVMVLQELKRRLSYNYVASQTPEDYEGSLGLA